MTQPFIAIVEAALAATPIPIRLREHAAVVLDRIACGAGATNWYLCRDVAQLPAIARMLSAGSLVSFYFDDRIRRAEDSPQFRAAVEELVVKTGDAMLGVLGPDRVSIQATFVGGADLAEELADLGGPVFFYGEFPGRDNDGLAAVTLQIPDRDGIVRAHPY